MKILFLLSEQACRYDKVGRYNIFLREKQEQTEIFLKRLSAVYSIIYKGLGRIKFAGKKSGKLYDAMSKNRWGMDLSAGISIVAFIPDSGLIVYSISSYFTGS